MILVWRIFLQKVNKTNWKFYKIDFSGGIERIDVYFIDEVQLKSGVGEPRQKTVNGQTVYYLVLENFDKNSSYGLRAPFDWRVYMGARADLSDRDRSGDSTLEVYFQNKADADETYRLMLTTGR